MSISVSTPAFAPVFSNRLAACGPDRDDYRRILRDYGEGPFEVVRREGPRVTILVIKKDGVREEVTLREGAVSEKPV